MKKTLYFQIQEGAEALQEGTFQVPSGCLNLTFTYDLDRSYTFLVFLLVRDPEGMIRFQKQLAYGESVIALGKSGMDTTIGGVPGDFPEGQWTLQICLFSEHLDQFMNGRAVTFSVTVSDEKSVVTEVIGDCLWTEGSFSYKNYEFTQIYQKESRWYKGDLHTHTRLSDGKETTAHATKKAEQDQLDYYVPTEHNVVHTGWWDTDVMILPGVEMTTILGHANLFGLTGRPETLDKILVDKDEKKLAQDIEAMIQECKRKGWLFSVNHPFLYIWKWLYEDLRLSDMDCLEIINDPTYAADPKAGAEDANRKAVFLSDLLWADGYRVCAIGGSDSHNLLEERYADATEPSVPGDPATWIYMDGLTPEHLMEGLKKCRAYVTRHCQIKVILKADGKPVFWGDQLSDAIRELKYEIEFSDLSEKPQVFFYKNGHRQECDHIERSESGYMATGTIVPDTCEYTWIRFGAEKQNGEFLLYANPVTIGQKKEHQFHTFGEVKTYLEGYGKYDKGNPV